MLRVIDAPYASNKHSRGCSVYKISLISFENKQKIIFFYTIYISVNCSWCLYFFTYPHGIRFEISPDILVNVLWINIFNENYPLSSILDNITSTPKFQLFHDIATMRITNSNHPVDWLNHIFLLLLLFRSLEKIISLLFQYKT